MGNNIPPPPPPSLDTDPSVVIEGKSWIYCISSGLIHIGLVAIGILTCINS